MTVAPFSVSCSSCACGESSCASCITPAECTNCVSCCCPDTHQSWRHSKIIRGIKVEYISAGWMGVEAVGAIAAGLVAGSLALLAFGGDSLVELLSGFAVLAHLRRDEGSQEGHGGGTARLASGLLFALIPAVGLGAAYSYFAGLRAAGSPWGLAIAAGSAVIMPYLWLEKRKLGKETRCLPLVFDSVESATCFFMSVALLGGLALEFFLGLWWADYLATGAVLAFVAREAVESYHELKGTT
ncbi:MAG: cation transporter [Nitrososphaerales archaeon]|nr:cation transporter [Nitrososphaerales archaeon]